MPLPDIDTSKCPLCGGPNDCPMAVDPNAVGCWCSTVTFPAGLLSQIPEEAVRKTCVCKNCLDEYLKVHGAAG